MPADPFAGYVGDSDSLTTEQWRKLREEIISRLDIAREYESLGVRFSRPLPDVENKRECFAAGRVDNKPSAFVNVKTGVYHDSGGSKKNLSFFDFALEFGKFASIGDVFAFYAEKAGVEFGKPEQKNKYKSTRYEYRREDGTVAYVVTRLEPPVGRKQFPTYPVDKDGNEVKGKGCMTGVKPLPWRLPELLASDVDDPVVIAEGEKAAQAIIDLGFLATTAHGGTDQFRKNWAEIAHYFQGRDCYLLPDNDDVGIAYMQSVAALLKPIARSVRVVTLPGLPIKGDAYEWVQAGGTAEVLGKLAYAAPLWEKPDIASQEAIPPVLDDDLPTDEDIDLTRMSDVVAKQVDWLWDGIIPKGMITLLAGEQKRGKSFLTMDLASRLSVGAKFPNSDGNFEPAETLLISAEDHKAYVIKPRLDAMGADCTKIYVLNTIKLDNGKFGSFNLTHIRHLERILKSNPNIKLIIIDPVTHYTGGKVDDHKATQVRELLDPLMELTERYHVATLLVTHVNKGATTNALHKILGSQAYTAVARVNWFVATDKDDDAKRLLVCAGMNIGPEPMGMAYRLIDGRIVYDDDPVAMNANAALVAYEEKKNDNVNRGKRDNAARFLRDLLRDGRRLSSDDIFRMAKEQGIAKGMVYKVKEDIGIEAAPSGFQGGWLWSLPERPVVIPIDGGKTF